jgi:hypothetical protein
MRPGNQERGGHDGADPGEVKQLRGVLLDGAEVVRPDPEYVIAEGENANMPFARLRIGEGSPGSTWTSRPCT